MDAQVDMTLIPDEAPQHKGLPEQSAGIGGRRVGGEGHGMPAFPAPTGQRRLPDGLAIGIRRRTKTQAGDNSVNVGALANRLLANRPVLAISRAGESVVGYSRFGDAD
jgi:hypothetical protein